LDALADHTERSGGEVELAERSRLRRCVVDHERPSVRGVLPRGAGAAATEDAPLARPRIEELLLLRAEGRGGEDASVRQRQVPAGVEGPERASRLPRLRMDRLRL